MIFTDIKLHRGKQREHLECILWFVVFARALHAEVYPVAQRAPGLWNGNLTFGSRCSIVPRSFWIG